MHRLETFWKLSIFALISLGGREAVGIGIGVKDISILAKGKQFEVKYTNNLSNKQVTVTDTDGIVTLSLMNKVMREEFEKEVGGYFGSKLAQKQVKPRNWAIARPMILIALTRAIAGQPKGSAAQKELLTIQRKLIEEPTYAVILDEVRAWLVNHSQKRRYSISIFDPDNPRVAPVVRNQLMENISIGNQAFDRTFSRSRTHISNYSLVGLRRAFDASRTPVRPSREISSDSIPSTHT